MGFHSSQHLAYLTVPWALATKERYKLHSTVNMNLLSGIPVEEHSRRNVLYDDVVTKILYYNARVLCDSIPDSFGKLLNSNLEKIFN